MAPRPQPGKDLRVPEELGMLASCPSLGLAPGGPTEVWT